MGTASNRAIIEEAFNRLAEADPSAFVAAMSDDLVWQIMGQSDWSRRFEGKHVVERDLVGPLFGLFASPYRNRPQRIIADDAGNVVVLAKGEVRTKSGQDYNNDYCFVMRMQDGRIVEILEYTDTALAEKILGPFEEARQRADGQDRP